MFAICPYPHAAWPAHSRKTMYSQTLLQTVRGSFCAAGILVLPTREQWDSARTTYVSNSRWLLLCHKPTRVNQDTEAGKRGVFYYGIISPACNEIHLTQANSEWQYLSANLYFSTCCSKLCSYILEISSSCKWHFRNKPSTNVRQLAFRG